MSARPFGRRASRALARGSLALSLGVLALGSIVSGALIASCTRAELVPDVAGGAGLLRNALYSPGVEVLVPAGPAAERCTRIAAARPANEPIEPRLTVRAPEAPSDPRAPRVVVGTGAEELAAKLARALDVELPRAGEFRYLGQVFDRPDDVLVATWRDPERPALPITLFFGNDLARLALDLDAPLWGWKPNVRVLRGGETTLEAPLELDGRCVKDRVTRPAQRRSALRKRYVRLPDDPAAFWGLRAPEVGDERVHAYLDACARAAMRSATWATPGVDAEPCEMVLHGALEDFEAWTGVEELALSNPHFGVVHALLAPASTGLCDDGGAAVARATLEKRLGPCFEPWIQDGAAVWAAGSWYGRDLAAWTGHLQRAGLALSVEALLDPNSDRRHSRHLLAPLRAELFGLLLETKGAEYVRSLWNARERAYVDAALDAAFAARLEARAAALPREARAREGLHRARGRRCSRRPRSSVPTHRPGYGTRAAEAAASRARSNSARAARR